MYEEKTREQAIEEAREQGWTIFTLVENGGYTVIDDMRGTEEWGFAYDGPIGGKVVWCDRSSCIDL